MKKTYLVKYTILSAGNECGQLWGKPTLDLLSPDHILFH